MEVFWVGCRDKDRGHRKIEKNFGVNWGAVARHLEVYKRINPTYGDVEICDAITDAHRAEIERCLQVQTSISFELDDALLACEEKASDIANPAGPEEDEAFRLAPVLLDVTDGAATGAKNSREALMFELERIGVSPERSVPIPARSSTPGHTARKLRGSQNKPAPGRPKTRTW